MPQEILEEVKAGKKVDDLLLDWLKEEDNYNSLVLEEEVDPALLQRVVNEGYSDDLTDDEIELLGRDPFLIAYAMVEQKRCVVTAEVSKPTKVRQNRKVPDVCDTMLVLWCDPFELNKTLDFRTNWKK